MLLLSVLLYLQFCFYLQIPRGYSAFEIFLVTKWHSGEKEETPELSHWFNTQLKGVVAATVFETTICSYNLVGQWTENNQL